MTDDIDKDAAEYAIRNLGKLLTLLSENEEKILARAEVYYGAEIERLQGKVKHLEAEIARLERLAQ